MAKNNMTAFDILMSRSGRKTTGAKNTAQEDIQKIGSSANEFQNALISTLSQPSRATDGPAQVQTPASQPQAIQTPELDSFRGNVRPTGETWEDTNALARQLDAEKAREAELQKTPERNVGGGLTTRQFEQTQDGSQGYVGRQAVGGLLSGTAEAANYFTNAALMAEPVEALTNTERLRNDAMRQEDIDRVYQEYLSGLSRDERDALEITGTLPSREEVYAQRMMPEAQSEVDNVDLSRRYNWDLPYLAETEKRYEGVEIGAGKKLAGDVARTVGQMAPAMALNFIPGAGQVLSSAYLFSSAAGAAMNEALANGATNRQAMDYGDAVGLVELATEKMFDGLGGLLGKGAADDMVEGIIKSAHDSGILKSNAGMNILRLSLGALGEGAEEVVSGLVNPLITKATLGKDKKLNWSEVGYDALLGVLTGGLLGNIGLINGQYKALNNSITSAAAAEVLNDFAETELGQQVVQNAEAIQDSPVGENTTQTQAPADDRLFHEPVNRSTANKILFDPEQRAAFEAETGVSLSNMSIRDAANLIMEYSRQSAETGQTGFDVAYPIKTPQAPKQFDHALTRSEAMRVANDPTLRTLFEQETGRTIPGKKYAVQFIQNVTAQLAEQANAPAAPTSPIAQTVMNNERQNAAQTTSPAQEIQTQETPRGRTAEERAEAERRAYQSERNILQSETPERQAYLTQKRQEHGAFLDGLKTGDKVYLNGESRPAFGVVSASENGMMLEFYDEDGNAYAVERVLPEAFTGDTAISMLETAESTDVRNEPAQTTQQTPAPQEQAPAQQPAPAPAPVQNRAAPARPAGQTGQVRSISEANTVQAVDAQNNAPASVRQEIYYNPVSEEESVAQARAMLENGYEGGTPGRPNTKLTQEQSAALTAAGQRLGGGYAQAIADMQGAPVWTAVQQDMSLLMFNALAEDAKQTGDWSAYLAWRIVDQEHATEIARALQARGKATRGETQDIMDYVADTINSSDMSQSAKDAAMAKTMQFAEEFTNTDKADADALRDLIVRMSDERKTGTVFKKNLEKLLNGQDAEYLAKIAEAQVKGMANDYIPASVGDKVKSWQTIAQLLKITTFARNLGGNETFGFMDALVGNTFGVALDKLVGGATGARAVGFDPRWFSSTQRKAAVDAMQKSMLEIALDVDMGSVGTKYDPRGRSFRMNGNPAERFASRLSQILSYSLTSSDAFFRGALEAGTTETLNRLNAGNEAALSQVEGVAQNRADYALFQNKGKTAQTARAFHDRLNAWIGTGGKVENGRRTGGFGLGDLIMPYATVPANLAIKPFEYSPLGIVKGGIELAKVLKNAQSGNVNLQAQHNAVMEIARGVTGLPVALLLSQLIRSGIVKRSDDDDDYDVTKARQSENRRETQWNLDATLRWLQGGSREWEEGDKLISLNWMEPMNAFMDIGALIADMQEDEDPTLTDYLSKYAIGSVQAAMEMPMIDGLQSAIQAMQYADSDNMWEKLGKFGESTVTSAATGMMPGAVSQLARTLDPTTRDTGADTFAARFANAMMNATPGLRTRLPEKLDSLGNPITNDNPLLNALNNFILPGQVAEYAPNDVVQALDEVYEATGKSNFYPDYKPPTSFSYDDADYKLDTEEKRLYQQTFGNTYEELVRNVTQSAEYDSLTAAEKAAVFSEMRSMATAEAKGAIVEGRGGEYTSDYDKVSELSDVPGYFSTKAMFSTASNEKNRDYERMPEILEAYGSLPEDVKEKLKTGNTSNMDELYDAWKGGVSAENWYKAYDAKADLEPYGDNKSVADWQKYQAMANVSSDKDMDVMLRGYMQDSSYESYMTARNDGLSAKDWADARAAAGMLTPPEGKENVPDALQYQAYAAVLDDKGMDAMMHATLEENPYQRYVTAREAGISAENWANAMASTVGLVPLEGHKDVTDAQKWQAMAGTVSDRDMDALMRANLSEGALRDYTDARNAGISAQLWADTRAAVEQLPVLEGRSKIADFQAAYYIGSNSDLSNKEKDALMGLYLTKGENGKMSTYEKYMACRGAGFAPQHLAKFLEFKATAGKKDDVIAAAMRYGFSEKNALALWNMFQSGHW